jgi:hypothetical protein
MGKITQAAQDQKNANFFQQYYAANPQLTPPPNLPTPTATSTITPQQQQAAQDTQNANFFQNYYAGHPALTAPANLPVPSATSTQVPGFTYGAPGTTPSLDLSGLTAAQVEQAGQPGASDASGDPQQQQQQDPEIRDSIFSHHLADLLAQVQRQREGIAHDDASDQQSYGENLAHLAKQRAETLNNIKTTANRQGLFYSGILGKRQGDANGEYDYTNAQNAHALSDRQYARQAQLQQIGNLSADSTSPYGYTGTGQAGSDLYGALSDAATRRVATGSPGVVPGASPATSPFAGSVANNTPAATAPPPTSAPGVPTPAASGVAPSAPIARAPTQPRTPQYLAAATKVKQQSAQDKKNAPYFNRLFATGQGTPGAR